MWLNAQHISNGLSSLLLGGGGNMGIGIEGEAGGEVAEHTADRLDVHAVLECDGGEGVT